MSELRDTDDEFVAQIRSNIRNEESRAWSGLVMVLIVSAIFLGVLEFRIPLESAGIAALAVFLVWIAFVFRTMRAVHHGASADADEGLLRKTIDDQHRRWRWRFIFVFVLVGALAIMGSFVLSRSLSSARPHAALVVEAQLAFYAIFAAFQICFGPSFLRAASRRALNDEHTRAVQHSAAMFGYLLSVIAMCACMVAMAIRPQWGIAAMPSAIAAVVILPGLYFLVLQWRAGRDG